MRSRIARLGLAFLSLVTFGLVDPPVPDPGREPEDRNSDLPRRVPSAPRPLRKLFRMAWEPCRGDCYEYNDVFPLGDVEPARARALLEGFVEIHRPLCGDLGLRYAIDRDDSTGRYVASFYHYGQLDLLSGSDPVEVAEALVDAVRTYFASTEGREARAKAGGSSAFGEVAVGACAYSEETDLRRFVVRAAGLARPGAEDAYLASLPA